MQGGRQQFQLVMNHKLAEELQRVVANEKSIGSLHTLRTPSKLQVSSKLQLTAILKMLFKDKCFHLGQESSHISFRLVLASQQWIQHWSDIQSLDLTCMGPSVQEGLIIVI